MNTKITKLMVMRNSVASKLTGNSGPMTLWTSRRTFSRCRLTTSCFFKVAPVERQREMDPVPLLKIVFLSLQGSSKTKRNRKQRHAYNKRRKAKAAQQSAASKPATTPAPAVKGKSDP